MYKEEIMEFGLIPKVKQFEFNSQQKTQIVNALKQSKEVEEQPDINEINQQKHIESNTQSSELSKLSSRFSAYNEFKLTNINFGFNNSSHDFFVKVRQGEMENQYPTDEMMRLKAYLMETNKAS